MSRDPKSLRKLLHAQDLKRRAAEAEVGVLKLRLAELKSDEDACHSVLQNPTLAVGPLARTMSKRLAGLSARMANVGKEIAAAEERVRIDSLRTEKVSEWLDQSVDHQQEAQLAEITEEAVAIKIRTSGRC